ncbi:MULTISPECIES: HD-GYP domain-containing protein [Luteimonas]|uniref:HD-GYP domain-containing protein n=1 Tax=Luteimonas TaxID=83614 RepID=UPI000C7A659A|nr:MULTISPECIES: HD-GYP domain-containing protein [Luteimonas]
MELEERRVAVADLKAGMYVSRLDRDWEGTPFLLQGVMVESDDDIATLTAHCRHVFVDVAQSTTLPPLSLSTLERAETVKPPAPPARRDYAPGEIEALQGAVRYPDPVPFDDELPHARDAQAQASAFARRILDDVRSGRAIAPEDVRGAVEPMVRSMVRNVDAFLWLESLRARGAYAYHHALNCSALAAAFGRHVGFPESLLVDMASGALLLDIGKLRVDAAAFAHAGPLSPAQRQAVQTHVEHALALVDERGAVPAHVRDMIRTHHEQVDGRGYPHGLEGDGIPLLGRIAAVVDGYDAMTSDRPHRAAVAPHVALQALYRARGQHYAAEVVEQFMQCMGAYPVGSLVELNTGEVAIVMAQNLARRLQPKVMLLTAPDKQPLSDFQSLDLMLRANGDDPVRIAAQLAPGAYGLDPVALFL